MVDGSCPLTTRAQARALPERLGTRAFAKTFLVVAPNVIVFERLRLDFEGGRVFRTDPIIPPPLSVYWDMSFFMRGDAEGPSSQGALHLTNIQQLYAKQDAENDGTEPDVLTAVLGPKPPAQLQEGEDFRDRILARGEPWSTPRNADWDCLTVAGRCRSSRCSLIDHRWV